MADPRRVAVRRQIADQRLARAAAAASQAFGVPFATSKLAANRYPDLHAAETTENVAEFLERITAAHALAPAMTGTTASAAQTNQRRIA